jgi:hypothetical protein
MLSSSVHSLCSGPIHPHDQPPKPAKRAKYNAAGYVFVLDVLLDLRRPAIRFSLGHPLFYPDLDHHLVAVKIVAHRVLLRVVVR